MNTEASTALSTIIRTSAIMSTEARRTQGRLHYGAKFDRAAEQHRVACLTLSSGHRGVWDALTAEGHISTAKARELLAVQG